MALEFLLPDIGEGLAEATIVSWLAAVGEEVGLDAPIVEIETDKAVVEVPAPRAGVVLHHGGAEGETIEVGRLLVVIGDPGEQWSAPTEAGAEVAPATPDAPSAEPRPIVGDLETADSVTGDPATGGGPVRALPLVRRLAATLGVDLSTVAGTGPGGRITRADVEGATATGPAERIPLSTTRRAIARNLAASWAEIPHVTTFGSADPSALLEARRRLAEETGRSAPLEALLISRLVPVLEEMPEFNASLDGADLVLKRHYDIGFAVDGPEGLLVAVVEAANERDEAQLAAEVARLAGAARDRTIKVDEMRGATFTVSNIGAVGGGYGTPIIPLGTTAILSVGRGEQRPVVRDGELALGWEMPLSLSYDHRVVDGALGRRFLAAVVAAIEGTGH